MSNKNVLADVVKGAAFTTVASILVPINILFLRKEAWALVIGTACIQVILFAIGAITLWKAHKQSQG